MRPVVFGFVLVALLGSASGPAPTAQAANEVPGTSSEAAAQSSNEASNEVPGTSRRPPIILISIDTLRSDRLPAYGYDGIVTPAIDRLRRDGILFRRAYSHVPLTLPSHVSMFTGKLPSEHGIRDNQGYDVVAEASFLPRRLQQHGYTTLGAVSSYVLHRRSGFGADGFDAYDDTFEPSPRDTTLGGIDRSGYATLDAATPWLQSYGSEPFFLFVHLFEPHLPYNPAPIFAERYGVTYDAEIATADDIVGRLLDRLDALGLYDEACIVLLSDHGEGLGDHGEEEHGILLYREALQVPLIVKLPDNRRRGEELEVPVQLADVYPTLLAIAGIDPTAAGETAQAQPLHTLRDDDPPRPIYGETYYPRLHYGWSELTSLILGDQHLIAGPDPELFHLTTDPHERHNVVHTQRRLAGQLRDALLPLQRPLTPPQAVDEATRQRLAALGYLSSTAPTSATDGPLPDPKAQLPSLQELQNAQRLVDDGDVAAAIAAYRRLLTKQPRLLDGWHALGELLRRSQRFAEAAEAYARASTLSGGDPDFVAATLASQIAADQLHAADEGLRAATHLRPDDTTLLRRQLADGWESRSLTALREQAWETARNAAQRAIDLDATRSESWNNLGVAAWYLGAHDDAMTHWRHVMRLNPQAWDTLYNLGTKAIEMDDPTTARQALARFIDGAPVADYGLQIRRAKVLLRRLERTLSNE